MASTRAIELILSVSPAQWCQACFLLAACGVLAVATAPSAERKLLVNYGARGSTSKEDGGDTSTTSTNDNILGAIRKVTSLGQIPHSWFMSFYASYLVCAAFWAVQYLHGGHVIRFIAGRQQQAGSPSMTRGQVMLAWSLMLLQAARRLYECIVLAKPSRSTMWIVHWLLGLCFYLGISCAIWIEGSGKSQGNTVLGFIADLRKLPWCKICQKPETALSPRKHWSRLLSRYPCSPMLG